MKFVRKMSPWDARETRRNQRKIRRSFGIEIVGPTRVGGEDGESKKREGRGCTGGIVCGVNVLRDSDQPENRFSDCATSLVSARE